MSSGTVTMTATAGGTAVAQQHRGYPFRRYYDPQAGQFTSVDPAVDQTEAAYAYASGDPIDNIDPSGLDICAFGHCLGTPSLRDVSNGVAGFGDMITFGGTAWLRGEVNNAFGLPNEVDYCSSWYAAGGYAGFGTSVFLGGYGLLSDAAEGGSLLERLRAIDWADETGSIGGDGSMLGEGGTQVTSRTLLRDTGQGYRIDVENPAPGVRPGQLHLQDAAGGKYLFNFETNQFEGLPPGLARQIADNPQVARAIAKARDYLNVR